MADKEFRLDDVAEEFMRFKVIDGQYKQAKKWLDNYKKLLKEVSGGANIFTIKDRQVAVMVPGKLNRTLLAQEQPDVVTRYTRQVVKVEFDEAAFRLEEPEMFEQYQAQALRLSAG